MDSGSVAPNVPKVAGVKINCTDGHICSVCYSQLLKNTIGWFTWPSTPSNLVQISLLKLMKMFLIVLENVGSSDAQVLLKWKQLYSSSVGRPKDLQRMAQSTMNIGGSAEETLRKFCSKWYHLLYLLSTKINACNLQNKFRKEDAMNLDWNAVETNK